MSTLIKKLKNILSSGASAESLRRGFCRFASSSDSPAESPIGRFCRSRKTNRRSPLLRNCGETRKVTSYQLLVTSYGFTLLEILIALTVLSMVVALSSEFIIKGFRTSTFESEKETAIRNARRGAEIMVKEIRGTNNSEKGDYPLAVIEEDDLIYYSDIDDDGYMEKIRYWADGNYLKKTVTPPGAGDDYSGTGETNIISNYLNNQAEPIFTYYDNDYVETASINSVRLINIRLKINVTPERAPEDYYVETDVHLRNLKDNL